MTVKIRRVGNSYTLTIPSEAMSAMSLVDGQELEVRATARVLEYHVLLSRPETIDWREYESGDADLRDGMDPVNYVRSLRDDDRF